MYWKCELKLTIALSFMQEIRNVESITVVANIFVYKVLNKTSVCALMEWSCMMTGKHVSKSKDAFSKSPLRYRKTSLGENPVNFMQISCKTIHDCGHIQEIYVWFIGSNYVNTCKSAFTGYVRDFRHLGDIHTLCKYHAKLQIKWFYKIFTWNLLGCQRTIFFQWMLEVRFPYSRQRP